MSKVTVNDASVLKIVETVDDKEVDITPEQPKPVVEPPAAPKKNQGGKP